MVSQVFDTAGEQTVELSQLIGHDGPVWQVTWAHPKFGSLLASCGLDHKVIVWKEAQEEQWVQVDTAHPADFRGHVPVQLADITYFMGSLQPLALES